MEKMSALLMVCCGACVGASSRFYVYTWIGRHFNETLLATALVNLLGSLLIGVCFVAFSAIESPRLQLFLMTGLLASFTTFSTLSLDALRLLSHGKVALALAHVGGQMILGISFCYFGVKIGHYLFR